MIKITNINFKDQTIENIQVDGESISNVELRLTKTKFSIVVVKEGKCIKKEIKKKEVKSDIIEEVIEEVFEPSVEPVAEPSAEPVVEPIAEQVAEPIAEQVAEPIKEVITLEKMKKLLKEHIPKQNTFDAYYRTISYVYNHFRISDMNELLTTKEQNIIDYLEAQYSNSSTIKNKLCCVYKAYKLLNIEGNLFKTRIDFYATKTTLQQGDNKDKNKRSIEEGDMIIEHFNTKLKDLGENIQENTDLLNNWEQEAQLYCVLNIYLTYGVLRPSELIDCLITETDDDPINYINIKTKQIVIHNHKNDRNGKKVIDISGDKKLLGILRKGLGKYLITNNNGELYQSSSAFSKLFIKRLDHNVYDLRKAVSSKCIAEGDIEKIKQLEHIQGHSLQVILDYYNVYTNQV